MIGAAYAGISFAPSNGLLVEGVVGIGTTNPTVGVELEVIGDATVSGNLTGGTLRIDDGTNAGDVQVGYVGAAPAGYYATYAP